jgi:hypothetical protein
VSETASWATTRQSAERASLCGWLSRAGPAHRDRAGCQSGNTCQASSFNARLVETNDHGGPQHPAGLSRASPSSPCSTRALSRNPLACDGLLDSGPGGFNTYWVFQNRAKSNPLPELAGLGPSEVWSDAEVQRGA